MKKDSKKTIEGIISTTSKGVGYVEYKDSLKDIEIEKSHLNTALNKDLVEVSLLGKKNGREKGVVINVLERAKTQFVGTIDKKNGHYILIPDDYRIYIDFLIKDDKRLKAGYKAVVGLKKWDDPQKSPVVELVKILGKKGENEAEIQSIIANNNILYDFPKKVEEEARDIKKNERQIFNDAIKDKDRKDIRDLPTMTIDPADAKDFDDALSFRDLGEGNFEIGVHIADVSHYVKPNTSLDKEARERGFSTYLVDRTIPMLPNVLSNDLCSLNPNVDRLTFSVIFIISKDGIVTDQWFGKTVIHSDKRFNYVEAQKNIDNKSGEFSKELIVLNEIAKVLRKKRFKEGSIDFSDEEVKFELDNKGKPIRVYKKPRLDTHKMVEEYMLLANKCVATMIYELGNSLKQNQFFVYRVHDMPNKEKLEELSVFLRALGYQFNVEDGVTPNEINKLLLQVKGSPEEGFVNKSLIRSMSKAIYSTNNNGHFGLAFEYYTHFTSPIRRYIDLMVHRLLYAHLHRQNIKVKDLENYENATRETTNKEISIMMAERESIKYKQVEYLQDKIGEKFDAIVSGVSEHGIFVEENETKANGLVRMKNIGDDYFNFMPKKFAVIGEKTNKKYMIGDSIKVKLKAANLDRRQLDFEMVS